MEFWKAVVVGPVLDFISVIVPGAEKPIERFATCEIAEKAARRWAATMILSGADLHGAVAPRPTGGILSNAQALTLLGEGTYAEGLTFLFSAKVKWMGHSAGTSKMEVLSEVEVEHLVHVKIQKSEEVIITEADLDTLPVSCSHIRTLQRALESEAQAARSKAERDAREAAEAAEREAKAAKKAAKSGRR